MACKDEVNSNAAKATRNKMSELTEDNNKKKGRRRIVMHTMEQIF
jgi:hypothetical protein